MHRHKVFVSYHHANDEGYKVRFERLFSRYSEAIFSRSVQIGDIDPYLKTETIRRKIRDEYLRDSTVTVVLVGAETWKRKHVDWEISSSIRDTEYNPRSGLLGILLPSYPKPSPGHYDEHTIPPRLHDNIVCGFATIYDWTENPNDIQTWVHAAFARRMTILPDNSRELYANNRGGDRWQ